jgi:MFS family permease
LICCLHEAFWLDRTVERKSRLLTRPFVLAVLAELGVCLTIGMLLGTLPLYAKGPLDAGAVGVGLAVAALSPTAVVFQPIAGRIGDRRGRRVLVIAGSLIVAGSVAAYTLAGSLAVLVVLRLTTGVGEALIFVGAATIVTDLAPVERRGEAISLYSLGLWSGLAVGPFLGELVLGDGRYDAVWLAAAACALAAALLGLALPETRPAESGPRSERLVHRDALRPGLVLVASVFGFAGFSAFVALYARELGLDGAGAAFLLFSLVVVAIRVLGRTIPDRLGPKRASGTALALLAMGLTTIGLWNDPAGLYLGTVVFAAGQALAFPALLTLAVAGTPASERSSAVGTLTACADVGFAVGALGLGGVAAVAGYEGVFLAGALASLAGAFLLARVPRPLTARPAEAS